MSVKNERCPKCGEKTEFCAFSNNPDILMCGACNFKGNRGAFEAFIPTLFDRITASPEVLAEKLVYCLDSSSFRVIDSAGRLLAYENEVWASTILPGSFWSKYEEAIAATVAKLKEMYDEQ